MSMFSGSVYAGFVLALSFIPPRDLEPECMCRSFDKGGVLMRGIKYLRKASC